MNTISNETRNRKSQFKTDLEAFADWVDEYAEAHGISVEETLNLALFRLEGKEYKPNEM